MLCAVPEENKQDGYMSAPEEEQQVVDADRVDHAASYMEMTVPLLHEAMPARTLLTDMSRPRKLQVRIHRCCSHAKACAAKMSAPAQGCQRMDAFSLHAATLICFKKRLLRDLLSL